MKKISSRLPVLLVLAALVLGAWIEVASAAKGTSLAGSAGSGTSVSSASRSGATTYSGDPDVGQNGVTQKRLGSVTGGGLGTGLPTRPDWTKWIWAMWILRVAR